MAVNGYFKGSSARLVKGIYLLPDTKSEVLRGYVHRHVTDYYNNDDDKWLADHAFYVKLDGSLDKRFNHCEPHYLADDSNIGD